MRFIHAVFAVVVALYAVTSSDAKATNELQASVENLKTTTNSTGK